MLEPNADWSEVVDHGGEVASVGGEVSRDGSEVSSEAKRLMRKSPVMSPAMSLMV